MNKRKNLILSITIVVAIVIIIAGVIFYNYYRIIPDKWDSIEGSLDFIEANESTQSIIFGINLTQIPAQMPLDSDREVILISVSANNTLLSSSNFSWDYLDLNNDNQINTGDEIIIYIDINYYIKPIGVGMLVSYTQGGLAGGWD